MDDLSNPSDEFHDAMRRAFPPVPTEDWLDAIRADLKQPDAMERLSWQPVDGLTLAPFYRDEDLVDLSAGPLRKTLPHRTAWALREHCPATDVQVANEQARYALSHGATAVGFYVSAVAGAGNRLLLRDQDDMARLLDGIAPDDASIHLMADVAARPVLALLLNELDRRGIPYDRFLGSLTVDPIDTLLRRGALHVTRSFIQVARFLADLDAMDLSLRALCVDARSFHEAGASPVDELALTLAVASEYLSVQTQHGQAVSRLARRLTFIQPVGSSFFLEIAKLRALRLLFPLLITGYDDEAEAPEPFVTSTTSYLTQTRYEPYANLLRATTQAAAAVIGGCDELVVYPFDGVGGTPSVRGRRLARNIQLILRHEAHLDAVTDPAAGSYYVEVLTDRLARLAWTRFQEIEAEGGLFKAVASGSIHRHLEKTRSLRLDDLIHRRCTMVGINRYPDLDAVPPNTQREVPPATPVPEGVAGLAFPLNMESLQTALREGTPTLVLGQPLPHDDALRVPPLPVFRWAAPFERLRERVERHVRAGEERPKVILLPVGSPSVATARATFAADYLGCAGLEVETPPLFATVDEGLHAVRSSGASIVVLCATDEAYREFVPRIADDLSRLPKERLFIVAGPPEGLPSEASDAAVDAFIYQGQDVASTLSGLLDRLGLPDETPS